MIRDEIKDFAECVEHTVRKIETSDRYLQQSLKDCERNIRVWADELKRMINDQSRNRCAHTDVINTAIRVAAECYQLCALAEKLHRKENEQSVE